MIGVIGYLIFGIIVIISIFLFSKIIVTGGKLILLLILFFLVITITMELTNTKMIKLVSDQFKEPKKEILFEPVYVPVIENAVQKILVNVKNNGDVKLSNIKISYVYDEGYENAVELQNIFLTIDPLKQEIFFIPSENNELDCYFNSTIQGNLYRNPDLKKCYYNIPQLKQKCFLKKIKIIFSSQELQRTFEFYYPVKTNTDWLSINADGMDCLLYNKSDRFLNVSSYIYDTLDIVDSTKYPIDFCKQRNLPLDFCSSEALINLNQSVEIITNHARTKFVRIPVL